MQKLNIYDREGGQLLARLEVEEKNPYDEGYLLTPSDTEEIVLGWKNMEGDPETRREYEFQEDNEWLATALYDGGELSVSLWESTTDSHDWDEDYDGPAFSTSMWPFDFHIEEVQA